MAQPTVQKNFRLPYNLAIQLENHSKESGKAQQDIVIQALKKYLNKEGRIMKYEVIIKHNGMDVASYPGLSEEESVQTAKKEASNKDCQVFVKWYRPSDGQHGYLNPDGNHAITGKAW